jgi:hypothetical protein
MMKLASRDPREWLRALSAIEAQRGTTQVQIGGALPQLYKRGPGVNTDTWARLFPGPSSKGDVSI